MKAVNTPDHPLRLHRFALSGHSHRAQLFLSILDLPHDLVNVDLLKAAHKQPEFLRLNSFGQVPVLEDGATVIADSNAILVYLAERYAPENWYPQNVEDRAAVQRWLSVAAGPLAFGVAAARRVTLWNAPLNAVEVIGRAHELLDVLEIELGRRPFLAQAHATIADLALYSYTALAPEGNVSLQAYTNVRAWLKRIEALPRFVPMPTSKVGMREEEIDA